MNKFTHIFYYIIIFCLSTSIIVFEEKSYAEELYPGYDRCMDRSNGITYEMMECSNKAYSYWKKRHDIAYKKLKKIDSKNKKLPKVQQIWIKYVEAMYDLIHDMHGGGSFSSLASQNFRALEMKKQAEIFEGFLAAMGES